MDSDGIDVFHVADGDRRIVRVPHDFVFDFLEALDALFHEHLPDRRKRKGVFQDFTKFLFIVGKSAARTAQRERGAQNNGIADLFRRRHSLFHTGGDQAGQDGFAEPFAKLFEKFAIFRTFDAFGAGAEHFHLTFVQDALFEKLHGEVKPRLPADTRYDGVRPFVTQNLAEIFQRERFHIYFVRRLRIGHDGRGIGVDEHNLVSFLFQRKARLRARIVEFRRLPDDDRAATYDEYFFQISSFRHCVFPP